MNNIVSGIIGNTLRRYLVVALMASLAVTGGMFAYAYTTSTQTITVSSGGGEYAEILPAVPKLPSYTIFGSYRGAIPGGDLFSINVTSGYPGDLAVNIYLDIIDQMGKNYGLWMAKLRLVQASDNSAYMDVQGIDRPLSLQNGAVTFVSSNMSSGTEYQVELVSGVYRAFPYAYWSGLGTVTPSLTAEVLQAQ